MSHACFAQAVRRYKSGDTALGAECPGCGASYAATVTLARVAAAAAALELESPEVEAQPPLFDPPRPQALYALNVRRDRDLWDI